jgi:predicted Zn-dependent protease
LLANSRDEERDADDGGFKAAVANGYDPNQAALIWDNVEKEYNVDGRKVSAFFSDHPATAERMATMEKNAKNVIGSRPDWLTNEDAYKAVMKPFLKQWVADDLARGEPKQSAVLFERLTTQSPKNGLYQFALGEAYRKRQAADDEGRAVAAYRAALACDDAPAQAWRGLGLIAMADGNKQEAKEDFSQYQAMAPDADDKDMISFYLGQL